MRTAFLLLALAYTVGLSAQEGKTRDWSVNGYLKNMQTLIFFNEAYPDLQQAKLVDTFLQDNLLHNRLNFRWPIQEHLRLRADLRTRVFFGDIVRGTPSYGDLVDNANNDFFDLSLVLLNDNSWVVHSMLDRFYLEYMAGDWEVRLGRQRINWGINTVWNPNDIFNAYAFTDFDYEERPGSDALRVKYYTGFASSIELAVRAFDDLDEATIAALWRFNKWNYDFQILTGYTYRDIALGGGWAGNLKNAGFKGEFTYFLATDDDKEDAFAATLGVDYSFSNSVYASTGYLYNNQGSTDVSTTNLFAFELSARNLYPYKHALFVQAGYPITPLLNTGLAVIYSPVQVNALFINPTFTYSIKENWDIDLIGQLTFDQEKRGYASPIQSVFLRTKWSY